MTSTLRLHAGDVIMIGAQVSAMVAIHKGESASRLRSLSFRSLEFMRSFRRRCNGDNPAGLRDHDPVRDFWSFETQRQIASVADKMAKQRGFRLP